MKAIVCGAGGAMGKLICARLGEDLAGAVSADGADGTVLTFEDLPACRADVILDFSHHTAISDVLHYALSHRCAAVIGTTGHTEEEKAQIYEAARHIPVFYCGNMSLGIAVLCRLAKQAAEAFPEADIEIVEIHHNRKADAPSGTAKMLFEAVKAARPEAVAHCGRAGEGRREKKEIGIASLRMGGVVGVHEVHICTESQCLCLRHEARDRGMFADGAVEAAKFICRRAPGIYDMQSMLEDRT